MDCVLNLLCVHIQWEQGTLGRCPSFYPFYDVSTEHFELLSNSSFPEVIHKPVNPRSANHLAAPASPTFWAALTNAREHNRNHRARLLVPEWASGEHKLLHINSETDCTEAPSLHMTGFVIWTYVVVILTPCWKHRSYLMLIAPWHPDGKSGMWVGIGLEIPNGHQGISKDSIRIPACQ